MVKQPCPNFRVITANVWMSELLGVLRYTTSITLSLVSKLISVSYPNYVGLRVKCIEGVLTSHLGSNPIRQPQGTRGQHFDVNRNLLSLRSFATSLKKKKNSLYDFIQFFS